MERRVVALLTVFAAVVLAGCTLPSDVLGSDVEPWDETEFVVAVDTDAQDDHGAFVADTREAVAFWERTAEEHLGHPVHFRVEPNASDPDVVVSVVADVEDCGTEEHVAGCAPLADDLRRQEKPVDVRVKRGFDRESIRQVLTHEFGHILGQGHDDPPASAMAAESQLATEPRPDATERPVPWADPELTVFLDDRNVSAADREQVRDQVGHALDYYERGADGMVPENVTLRLVDDRESADVLVSFPDPLPCDGVEESSASCRQLTGVDPDRDGVSERYTRADVYLSDIDPDAVGWHVGRWLGDALGADETSDLAPPFRDASYEERRSEWWR
ncbi:matrixin [Halorientalis halophila]|uniref:matrixin n=1 Tax=Halorientalis halophila TaxID=3108499 RepID=UPI003009F3A6